MHVFLNLRPDILLKNQLWSSWVKAKVSALCVSECPCLSSAAECSKNSGPLLSLPQSLPTPTPPTLTGQNPQYGRRLQSSELCTLLSWTDLMYSVCQSLMCIRLLGTIIGNITRYRKALRKEIYLALRWNCISTTIVTTGFSSHLGAKLRDLAERQVEAGCFSWAQLSSNDSKTR